MDGFGNINWWGFSPCVDLLKLYSDQSNSNCSEEEPINILLVNSGDQRHILKSLGSKKIFGKRKKSIFISTKKCWNYTQETFYY